MNKNEILVNSYKPINELHLSKTGFIQEILANLQKILRMKLNDEAIKLENVIYRLQKSVYKINIRDKFNYLDLWMIQYLGENSFLVDFYTLKKINGK